MMSLCMISQWPGMVGSQSICTGQQDMRIENIMPILMRTLSTMRTIKPCFHSLLVVTRISMMATEILPVASADGVNWKAIHVSFIACLILAGSSVMACLPRP